MNNKIKACAPVLLITFNRKHEALTVLECISQAQPAIIYLASDGPRSDVPGESTEITEIREALLARINWDCAVKTLFHESNLGCKNAVVSALDWFFNEEQEGIILEDDCVPAKQFFTWQTQMLKQYRNTPQVGMVAGDKAGAPNFLFPDSYGFSPIPRVWGWATWSSTWKLYKKNITTSQLRTRSFNLRFYNLIIFRFLNQNLNHASIGTLDTWDYQLVALFFNENLLCAIPSENLIQNIGFNENATHTTNVNSKHSNRSFGPNTLTYPKKLKPRASILLTYYLARDLVRFPDFLKKIISSHQKPHD